MKITLLGPVYPYRGGIAHYTTLLSQAIQAQHSLQLISFKRQYPAWLYPGQSDRDPSSQPLHIDAQYLLDPLNPRTWQSTLKEIEAFCPQSVVLQWWTTFWAPAYWYLARKLTRKGIPIVYLVHNVLPHEARPWDRWLARLALRPAAGFIVQTGRENERLQELLPGIPVTICPHPIYDMFASQQLPQDEARAWLGLPADKPIGLFFGIVRPYKGLQDLLDAVARLKAEGISLRLLVAGEIWGDPSTYYEQINSLGIAELATIDNRYIPNEEVKYYFSAASFFIAPYTAGTASGATKLALGFGLPVVVTRNIVDETLQNLAEREVFIAEPNDPASLSQAIRQALTRPGPGRGEIEQDSQAGWTKVVEAIDGFARQAASDPPGRQAPVGS